MKLWFDESREEHYSDITVSVRRMQGLKQKSDMIIAYCTVLLGVYSGLLLTFSNSTHLLVHDITPHGILHTSNHVIARMP
jgi:protein tyrosine/serine phosphatase